MAASRFKLLTKVTLSAKVVRNFSSKLAFSYPWTKYSRNCHTSIKTSDITNDLFGSVEKNDREFSIQEINERLKDIVGAQKLFSESVQDRSKLLAHLPKSQSELQAKSINESFQVAWLRLSDSTIRENYLNVKMRVKFGRILEDLDTFAVWLCYVHNHPSHLALIGDVACFRSPLVIVTAMVDQIVKQSQIEATNDIRMTGCVSWVGQTSMEVTMQLQQQMQYDHSDSPWDIVLEARFLMVARDPLNQGSAFVTPIDLLNATPNEKSLFELGESHKIERQKRAKTSLLKTSPSPGESALIHSMFLDSIAQTAYSFRARVKPEGSIWMEETLLQNVLMNHPQERNIYGKMFGGYLMRQAFELALSNAVLFSEHLPSALSVADIDFQKPVEIGTLLFLSSQVVYTIDSFLQIKVHAEVVNPKKKLRETTNVFHFTFGTRQGEVVPTVLPKTYTEYMLYIDGKRHLEAAMPVQQ